MRNRLVLAASLTSLALTGTAPLAMGATDGSGDPAPVRVAPEVLDPRDHGIGRLLPDFEFVDVNGDRGRLSDYAGNRATVIAMHSVDCPLSKKFTPKLARLQEQYGDKGLAVLLVNPTQATTAEQVEAFREEYGLDSVRYVLDADQKIAATLRATSTTDAFVIDASRTLRYRGAVDDQYGLGYVLDAPRRTYLMDAVLAALDRRLPGVAATSAPGCALEIDAKPVASSSEITYHNRVSRILQQNCQKCHRPGEVGPFPLLSYEDAVRNKGMMKYVVSNELMPPWFASGSDHEWGNDQSLSERDREDLLAWIDAGCPKGDPKNAVAAVQWTEGWQIGEPDLIVETPRVFRVPAEGSIPYQYTKVRLPLEEDRWVQAMEIRAGAPEVVHHVLVMVKYPRRHPKDLEQPDFMDGLGGYFAVMVPGQGPTVFPEGTAKFLPRGSTLIFQMHYTPVGKERFDQTKMAFVFADEEPLHEVKTRGVAEVRFAIPPGADNHAVTARHRFNHDTTMLSLFPHMHLRGKAFRYELEYPDGEKETLLDISRYDFNWQLLYRFRDPIDVPAGSVLTVTGWFDNSKDNPANPDPNKTVYFGEQTWEEMMIGYFDWLDVST